MIHFDVLVYEDRALPEYFERLQRSGYTNSGFSSEKVARIVGRESFERLESSFRKVPQWPLW